MATILQAVAAHNKETSALRPIRVVCLIKGLGRGGAELLLHAQMCKRDRQLFDHRVVYLTPSKRALVDLIEAEGVDVHCVDARSSRDLTWIGRLRRLLREQEIDVVHAHSPIAAAGARLAIRTIPARERPRIVTTEHNVWSTHVRLTRWADASTAHLDDAHVAVSGAVRDSLPARLRDRTEVIRHGIDVTAVAALRADREAVRRELGLDGRIVVGTVANLRATKGWPDLLVAARSVLDAIDSAQFVAVGQGPMEQEVAALHAELGLGERFRLLGYREDAVRIMAGCDVFCLASHHEGLPVAVMEAMALGLPVVATDVGGMRELVTDGVHGRLVPSRRPELLARSLIEVLGDDAKRAAMAEAVDATVDQLSADSSIRRLEAIYRSLAGR